MSRFTTRGHLHAVAAAIVAVASLTACSSGSRHAAAPKSTATTTQSHARTSDVDPCKLLTQHEVESLIGPAAPAKTTNLGNKYSQVLCEWRGTSTGSPRAVGVFVTDDRAFTPNVARSGLTAKTLFDQLRAAQKRGAIVVVDGVGDGAFLNGSKAYVRVGSVIVNVNVGTPDAKAAISALRALLPTIVDRVAARER